MKFGREKTIKLAKASSEAKRKDQKIGRKKFQENESSQNRIILASP